MPHVSIIIPTHNRPQMLREAAKQDGTRTTEFLLSIRKRAPRLVLRTACETLKAANRKQVLA